MKKGFITVLIVGVIGAIIFSLPTPETPSNSSETSVNSNVTNSYRLQGATVFDGYEWSQKDLCVHRGRVIDCAGELANGLGTINLANQFIIPGLIDSHTHTWGDALTQALTFGVTTELDMFTQPFFLQSKKDERDSINYQKEADFFSSGILVTSPGGHGTEYGIDIPTITSPDQATQFVADRLDEGSDYIKVVYHHEQDFAHFTSISYETLKAVISAAHEKNKIAVVHVSDHQSADEAISAGADGLVHIFGDKKISDELVKKMKARNVFVIPTLSVIESVVKKNSLAFVAENSFVQQQMTNTINTQLKQSFDADWGNSDMLTNAMHNVKTLADAGISILAGTDAPNPGTSHGISMHNELRLLIESGLSIDQTLKASTSAAHEYFPIGERGHLQVGALADFLILDKDIRTSISNGQFIRSIYKNGYSVLDGSEKVTVMKSEAYPTELMNDFAQKELASPNGHAFFVTTDEMMNGNSTATLKWMEEGLKSPGYASISGVMGNQFPYPWAGLMTSFSRDFTKSFDLSRFTSINFTHRGTKGSFRMLIFVKNIQRPSEIRFDNDSEWQETHIRLAERAGIDWENVTAIAWVAGAEQKDFQLDLDHVNFQ